MIIQCPSNHNSREDYFNPLIYLSSESKYTLQLGLTTFEGGGGGAPQWNLMMAARLLKGSLMVRMSQVYAASLAWSIQRSMAPST